MSTSHQGGEIRVVRIHRGNWMHPRFVPENDAIVTLTKPAIIGGEEWIFARLSPFSDNRRGIGV
jgi:hypothetical protein